MPLKFCAGQVRPWGPVVEPPSEDAFLTEHPIKVMHTQGGHKIPMIIGYNSGEGIFFELVRRTVPCVGIPKHFEEDIPFELGLVKGSEKSKEVAEKIKKIYFGGDDCNEEAIDKLYTLKGDTNFIHSIQRAIKLQTKHSDQPVFAYRMSLVGPLNFFHTFALTTYFKSTIFWSFLSKMSSNYLPSIRNSVQSFITKFPKKDVEGVVHADDLLYLFPTFYSPKIKVGSPEDLYIQRFVKLWTNFAKYGVPTSEDDETLNHVKWKQISLDNMEFLDIGNELKMIENVDAERLKFWDDLYATYLKI